MQAILNTIGTPKNYSDMLRKIFVFNLLGSLLLFLVVYWACPTVEGFAGRLAIPITSLGVNIKLGYIVPPLLFALISRFTKLHDRVSDLVGIRRRFDVDHILVPLAEGVGIVVNPPFMKKLREQRVHFMYRVFYEYASSAKPQIDEHLIRMALDRWTWWWVLVELLVAAGLTLVILLVFGAYGTAAWLGLGTLVGLLLTCSICRTCAKPARLEVEAILADQGRRDRIRTELEDALSD